MEKTYDRISFLRHGDCWSGNVRELRNVVERAYHQWWRFHRTTLYKKSIN